MANRLPLIQNSGQLSQLKTPDLLVDVDGHGYVDAASAFGTDDVLVASDGTARGVKATTIDKDNVATAAAAFGTDDVLIASDGTGKGLKATAIDKDNVVTAAAAYGTDDVLIASDGTGKGTKATTIDKDNVVTAAAAYGVNESIVIADGTGKATKASAFTESDLVAIDAALTAIAAGYVSAAIAFGTDDVLLASDGTGRGAKATTIDKDNVVTSTAAFAADQRVIVADGAAKAVESSDYTISDVLPLLVTATKTGAYTAAKNDLVVCDCSGGSFTVTLPSATVNDEVGVLLLSDTVPNTVTIDSDGGTILGKNGSQGSSIVLYIENDYVRLKYIAADTWQIVDDERTLHYAEMRGDATTGQTIAHNTTTVLDFATSVADNAGLDDTSTDAITIRRAGRYSIYASCGVASGAVLQQWSLNIRKNGSNIRGFQQLPAAFSSNVVNNISSNADFAAGDVITVSVVQQSSDSSNKTVLLTEATTSRLVVQEIR